MGLIDINEAVEHFRRVVEATANNNAYNEGFVDALEFCIATLSTMPAAKPLTDAEKRIFLAAMERELEVCKEIDSETVREAYEVSLVKVCKEIKRKVMGALWT
jgi:glycyl-tRNA synthetase beta subunit